MLGPLSLGALNHLLRQADWARTKLIPFAGSQARLAMPPFTLDFAVREDGTLEAATGGEPDVTITLPADTPLRALQGQNKVMEAARVEGNAQFATELSFVLRNLRWDAEEDLAHFVGDIAARRMAQGAADFTSWQRASANRFAENIIEYASEENPLLARQQDIDAFSREVAQLSNEIVQLEKSIERIARTT